MKKKNRRNLKKTRTKAKKMFRGETLYKDMLKKGIYVKSVSYSGLAEEAGDAYKDIDDVVDANIGVGLTDKVSFLGEVFNIGYGKNYSVNQIAEWMGGETTNIPPRVEPKETLLNSNKLMSMFDWKPTINLKKWLKLML